MEIKSPERRSHTHSFSDDDDYSSDFEFCMANSHSEVELGLHSADELFVDGVLVPLHLLSLSQPMPKLQLQEPQIQKKPESGATSSSLPREVAICSFAAPSTGSKRWKDMLFMKKESIDDKERKKETKNGSRGGTAASASSSAELNINIWPFSRSRSAGAARPKAAAMRKSSSAPCSRSNSQGESSGGKRWVVSPGRAGVHVGRASAIWQVRREKARRRPDVGVSGLSLDVNGCIGYGDQPSLSCRAEDIEGVTGGERNGGLLRIKAFFTKKVY